MTTGFPSPVKMPAAMRLTVLTLMFVVAAGQDSTTSSAAQLTALTQMSSTQLTSTRVTQEPTSVSSTTETNRLTLTATSTTATENTSSSPPSSTSLQTSQDSASTLTAQPSTTANQTSSETTSHGLTFTSTAVTVNTTSNSTAPLQDKNKELWNPGLVAVLCIFCIVVGLMLVVATIKCVRSRRSNFERLEDDLPMSKVNEQSPFAHYSK